VSGAFSFTNTPGAQITGAASPRLTLEIPPGPPGQYRLAQIDDYTALPRKRFPHHPPRQMALRARVSHHRIPGTWGFGLWNDPFSFSLGLGGGVRRFPALPNAAWFFFASPENYLSLRDDLPAAGALAATFRSARAPLGAAALAGPALPLLWWPPAARLFRKLARAPIQQAAVPLTIDPAEFHHYQLAWNETTTTFSVDGAPVLVTPASPRGPLGAVVWIDNQYAALPPDGRLRFGTLPATDRHTLEVENLVIDDRAP